MADTKPKTEAELLAEMSIEDRIKYHRAHGQGSIQDMARVYHMSVDEVLHILGEDDMTTVRTEGDLIDASEAGPGASMNYGRDFKVPFTTN